MKTNKRFLSLLIIFLFLFSTASVFYPVPSIQADNPNPPNQPVKLIFIHHSTGENWLTDGYGDLGRTLGQNNYFVSDTNYGWGPNGIGDRTDIPNWTEWFRSADTPVYMDALFNESGQNSYFTRSLSDPGGENQIVMFKSCFPNSELYGSPNDPPGTYEELSVSGAKYVYNEILQYFATRPDKLFIVITAPPLSDNTYAANARAFNNWLVNDWLRENNYALNNVAVFDFYNVLTSPDAHHRYRDGQIEHIVGNRDTLYYPSDDDHPSEAGSRKATEEFIPLLNIYYHRWQADAPPPSAPVPATAAPADSQPGPGPVTTTSLIDNFETDNPPGTNGWEPFWDESTPTSMHCAAEPETVYSGQRSLRLDFEVTPDAWATCALFYDNPQDWGAGEGITFFYHSSQPLSFDVNVYVDSPDGQESYVYPVVAEQGSLNGWAQVSIAWAEFRRVEWEANAGTPFAKQDQISGMAFGFESGSVGQLWVDDLSLLGAEAPAAPPSAPEAPEPAPPENQPAIPCFGSLTLPLLLAGLVIVRKR